MIPWDARSTEILLNPRMPSDEATRVRSLIERTPSLAAHVWLTTSGSTGRLKPVGLSKHALLVSAAAVNQHLASDAHDIWLNVLPTFHVGGLGIHARSHLSGARVATLNTWSVETFMAALATHGVTLTALVPTHVFDLVRAEQAAPSSLRAVVVGGGALDERLYHTARDLAWPLLPSYGATECASQIATADVGSLDHRAFPALSLLTHVTARTDPDGRLSIRSDALFTGYATETGLDDPKRDGWWRTDDQGAVADRVVAVSGRADDTVKVGGELVNLNVLESRLAEVGTTVAPGTDAALFAAPDARLEHVIVLAVATADVHVADGLLHAFNETVLPYERARMVRCVDRIPRTALGKVVRGELGARALQT